MHFCILCNEIAPDRGGVSDYTSQLINELQLLGHRVSIVTNVSSKFDTQRVSKTVKVSGWGFTQSKNLALQIKNLNPDVVWLQWVPQMYGRYGIHFGIANTVSKLSVLKIPIWTMVHEAHVEADHPIHFISKPFQKFALKKICQASDKIGVSIEAFLNQVCNLGNFSGKSFVTGFPSTIANLGKASPIQKPSRIVCFSPLANGLSLESMIQALTLLKQSGTAFEVYWLGVDQVKLFHKCPAALELADSSIFTGYLDATQVSEQLNQASIALSIFDDGASSRRTSLMASLAHGLTVVTNRGRLTNFDIDAPFAWTTHEPRQIAETLKTLLQNNDLLKSPKQVKTYYENHFSWKKQLQHWGLASA